MTLWVNPGIARGVLGHLAATQADEVDPERDAQPGKILQQARRRAASLAATLGVEVVHCDGPRIDVENFF